MVYLGSILVLLIENSGERRATHEEMIHAILGHADYCNVARTSSLDKTLFACDKVAGFLTACALSQTQQKHSRGGSTSVKKKLKDKASLAA